MNLKDILNSKNIKSFIEGNSKYVYNKFVGLPSYIKEQVAYRLLQCKDDCVPNNKCKYCGCPPKKKAFVHESCNKGVRFPNLMNEKDWNEYKRKHNI